MDDSIFTKIIKGEVPSHKVYEDAATFAFLDIHPIQPGHTLVIPKKQVEFVWDLEETEYRQLMETVQKVALRLREVMAVPYVGTQIMGTDVPHAHVHLIPFSTADEFKAYPDMTVEPDHELLASIAEKLRF